jgi:putative permease
VKEISDRLIKFIIFSVILTIFIAFLFAISNIVKLVIISALLAYVLDPLASFLESRGISRMFATVTIFGCIFILSAIAYIIFSPVLSEEMKSLQTELTPENTSLMISKLENFLVSNLSFLGIKNLHLLSKLQSVTEKMGDWFLTHVIDAASVVTSIILIPFIVFFLIKDGRQFKKSFVSILPNRYFEFSLYLFHKLNIQMGNYLRGQILDAAMVGILAILALWLIGVKYFIIIGSIAGIANLVPYFGPIAGVIIATIVSILQTGSFHLALYVIFAFIIIKLLDDSFIQPIVVSKSVHLHPVTVLLAVLIGGKLFGILGMLLSVPVTAFIKVVVYESIINYRRYKEV